MLGGATSPLPHNGHAACTGCSLCLLVCPVWRKSHDVRLTPHGRAKALQHGATIADIAESIESCTLCGACEPACPETIDLVGMIVGLRQQLPQLHTTHARRLTDHAPARPTTSARSILLAGSSLRDHPATLARVATLLELDAADDDGADIAFALETGGTIAPQRLEGFLAPLRKRRRLVVADGLLLRHLLAWLPRARLVSLGAALSRLTAVRRALRATDLYVVEPRGYHADYTRQVRHYDALRVETGCAINLDLQRIAIPATARSLPQRLGREAPDDTDQARWILHGRRVSRIVVEALDDLDAFAHGTDCPVLHVAHLLDSPDTRLPNGTSP